MKRTEVVLASYVTYKELYRGKKYNSPYQILAEFIKYIIYVKKIYQFSSEEINRLMNDEFGFDLPRAVLKSTLKKIESVKKIQGQELYSINFKELHYDDSLERIKVAAEQSNGKLVEELFSFVEQQRENKLSEVEKRRLVDDLIEFLLDDSNGGENQNIISAYILKCSEEPVIAEQIKSIREGCILYTGISNSIDQLGSVTKPITFYLDMEVLFDLYGYNGELFQELALDLIKLIQEANKNTRIINLRYFKETKKEIESFFKTAEDIVEGKVALKIDNIAMKTITTGCEDATDVNDKCSDFFYKLRSVHVVCEDEVQDYYSDELKKYNLEDIQIDGIDLSDATLEQGVRFASNINKLRKGYQTESIFDCKYGLITETGKFLEVSQKIISRESEEGRKFVGYAFNMGNITNLLWYKLNKGFGSQSFPQNVDAAIKAKILLSSYITQNISTAYDEIKKELDNGKITEEIAIARITGLKNKSRLPEEIDFDSLEDDLDFSSERIRKYEMEHEWQKEELHKKDAEINELKSSNEDNQLQIAAVKEKLSTTEAEKAKKEEIILNQAKLIDDQQNKLNYYENKEKQKEIKLNRWKFVGITALKIVLVAVVFLIAKCVLKFINIEVTELVLDIIALGSFIGMCFTTIKKDFLKYWKRLNENK